MIVTFTDFGSSGPYLGQMRAALYRHAPNVPVVDLLTDAPLCNPKSSAYLLAALVPEFEPGTVFLCVVDPGVGGARAPVAVESEGRWFVGPDNGLFELAARRRSHRAWEITWRPERLSMTFHGRDLFAPIAARLAVGERMETLGRPTSLQPQDWPDDLAEVVYVDHYGNVMTGLRGAGVDPKDALVISGHVISPAERFDQVEPGQPFWYVNSCGLVEIAVNQGRADSVLCVRIGDFCGYMK